MLHPLMMNLSLSFIGNPNWAFRCILLANKFKGYGCLLNHNYIASHTYSSITHTYTYTYKVLASFSHICQPLLRRSVVFPLGDAELMRKQKRLHILLVDLIIRFELMHDLSNMKRKSLKLSIVRNETLRYIY